MMHNKQENKVPQKGARLALEALTIIAQSNANSTSKSHTTTSQLKHDSNVIKQKTSVQSTGKVEAQTDTSSKYTSGWTSSVLYHLY